MYQEVDRSGVLEDSSGCRGGGSGDRDGVGDGRGGAEIVVADAVAAARAEGEERGSKEDCKDGDDGEALEFAAAQGDSGGGKEQESEGECVAALFYAYDYAERDLAKRLARTIHENHDLSVASLQVCLDHDSRMEVNVLCGDTHDVRKLGESIIAERGVRHGRLYMLPAEFKAETHAHAHKKSSKHRHMHVRKAG